MKQDEKDIIIQRINEQMLEMHAAMAKSDAKASKCEKMGLSFMETYPQEYQEYLAANRRFNELEEELERVEAIEVEPDEGGEDPLNV